MKLHTLAAVACLSLAGAAFAQTPPPANPTATPRIDQRQANQQKRIDQGVASGSLTEKEAARLQKRETNIAKTEEKAKADGVVTDQERARIKHKENKASRDIKRQKHDKQKTAPAAAPAG